MASLTRDLRSPKLWIGLLISAALLALVLTRTDLGEAWRQVKQVRGQLLWLPLLLSAVAHPVRGLRWQWVFAAPHRPSYGECLRVFVVSNMANVVLPARGGDVLRCFLIGRQRSLANASRVLATLGVERVADALTMVIVGGVALLFISDTLWLTRLVSIGTVVVGVVIVGLILLERYPEPCRRLLTTCLVALRLSRWTPRRDGMLTSFVEGLAAIRSPRSLLMLAATTALVWLIEAAFIWAMAAAVNLHLSFAGSALVAVVIGLGMMIPAAPGAVGTYEFVSVAVLGLLGVAQEPALALTLLMHAWVLLVLVGAGLLGLAASGLSFSRLVSAQYQSKPSNASS